MYEYASYYVINVSSPNTPGLRELQDKKPLTDIVQAVKSVVRLRALKAGGRMKPIYVKIAPELTLTQVDDVIQVVMDEGLAGIIATNTTTNEEIKLQYGFGGQVGGLSGNSNEYRSMVLNIIRHIYKQAQGKLEIIGTGSPSLIR